MIDLGPHTGFIVASYASAILLMSLLIGWIYVTRRKLNQQLKAFEDQGLLRKSSARAGDGTKAS